MIEQRKQGPRIVRRSVKALLRLCVWAVQKFRHTGSTETPEQLRPSAPSQQPAPHRPSGIILAGAILCGVAATVPVMVLAPVARMCLSIVAPLKSQAFNARRDGATKLRQQIAALRRDISALQMKVRDFIPSKPYFVVSTSENVFFIKRDTTAVRKGSCSTGSYTLLTTPDKKRQWMFKTPRGRFRIQNKIENPVWRMPDWAYVEMGKSIPAENSPDRYEPGVLGSYAMVIGNGYMIHGTLYQRFLGLPVTHGCIRLGDDDLDAAYRDLDIGSAVYIY
jgi:L,D-transpeptidase YbiS